MPEWIRSKESPDLWIKAGWDPELITFYAVVLDRLKIDYTPALWVGKTRGEISTTTELRERLQPKYTLSERLIERLEQERLHNPPPRWSFPVPKALRDKWDEWLAGRQLEINTACMFPEVQGARPEIEPSADQQQELRHTLRRSR